MPCAIAPLVVESDEELGTRRKVSGIENAGTRNCVIGLSFIFLAVGCVVWVIRDRRDPLRSAPTESVTEAVGLPQEGPMKSKFVTNSPWKTGRLKAGKRSLIDAFKDAFPNEKDWWATSFPASNHPDKTWWWQDVVYWAQYELLNRTNHTFPDGKVPIPVAKHGDDQLDPGHYVGYTRRQVCYLAAAALTGAEVDGYANGLTRYLSKKGPCLPRKSLFGKALFGLLTTCAADPMLSGGLHGPMLLVVKHKTIPNLESQLKNWSKTLPMSESGFRLCRYEEGSVYKQGFLPGIPNSPKELCSQPTSNGPGVDYLSTPALKQALVDSSGPWVGGNLYGGSCGTEGNLEEALMAFMPEVAVLSLFLSQDLQHPQLRAPAWVLGARMILTGLDGTRHWTNWRTNPDMAFRTDLTTLELEGQQMLVSNRKPFVAAVPAFQASFDNLKEARQNRALAQRQVHGPNSFKQQVMAWYQALSLDALPPTFRDQMPKFVASLGSGPWMSGHRFGDSQLDVLAIWLGQTLASRSWKASVFLDFYMYSAF